MSIATLMSVPRTPVELQAWQFANQASHRDIERRVFETQTVTLAAYPLEPFNPDDFGSLQSFLNNHQDAHQAFDKALGLNSYNLSEVNWQDEGSLAQWVFTHGIEHILAAKLLGIS